MKQKTLAKLNIVTIAILTSWVISFLLFGTYGYWVSKLFDWIVGFSLMALVGFTVGVNIPPANGEEFR